MEALPEINKRLLIEPGMIERLLDRLRPCIHHPAFVSNLAYGVVNYVLKFCEIDPCLAPFIDGMLGDTIR